MSFADHNLLRPAQPAGTRRASLFRRQHVAGIIATIVSSLLFSLLVEASGMTDRKSPGDSERDLRQARVTTDSSDAMRRMLEGREVEIVGRGPHQADDGTWFAEIIGSNDALGAIPKDLGKIEVRAARRMPAAAARQVSEGNRYLERGSVPRGVGIKE